MNHYVPVFAALTLLCVLRLWITASRAVAGVTTMHHQQHLLRSEPIVQRCGRIRHRMEVIEDRIQRVVATVVQPRFDQLREDVEQALQHCPLRPLAPQDGSGAGNGLSTEFGSYFVDAEVPPILVDDPEGKLYCSQLAATIGTALPSNDAAAQAQRLKTICLHRSPPADPLEAIIYQLTRAHKEIWLLGQFANRVRQYRELFQPMIDAMERRNDTMLFNFI